LVCDVFRFVEKRCRKIFPLSGNALNDSAPKHSGLLVACLLLGLGIGFAPFEMYAALDGYGWLSKYHLNRTLIAMVVGGTIGLVLGLVLDTKLRLSHQRAAAASWIWTLLVVGAFLYLFFRPAFQGVR
jgi:uncharacterized protein YacL